MNGHYCGTIGISDKWTSVKGENHSYEVRPVTNVRRQAKLAEEHYHEVKRADLKSEYDYLLSELETSVDNALALHDNMNKMVEIMTDMSSKIQSLIHKTDIMKGKLLILGVKANDFSKRKTFDISQLKPPTPQVTQRQVPTVGVDLTTTTPSTMTTPLSMMTSTMKTQLTTSTVTSTMSTVTPTYVNCTINYVNSTSFV